MYFLQFRVGSLVKFNRAKVYKYRDYFRWHSRINYVLYNLYLKHKYNLLQNSNVYFNNDLLYYRYYLRSKILTSNYFLLGHVKFLIKSKLQYISLVKYSKLNMSQSYNIIQYNSNIINNLNLFNINLLVRSANYDKINAGRVLRFFDLRYNNRVLLYVGLNIFVSAVN